MKTITMPNGMSRMFNRVGMKFKKHSPEILIVAGVAGAVTSAVMACKATLKVHEVLEPSKINIDKIHEAAEKGVTEGGVEYSVEDSKKDLVAVYAQTGVKLVKLYAPAVTLGALSITAILTSNNIIRKRNVALAAAYTAVDTGFKEYRGRVLDRFGKNVDRELLYNIKAQEIEETVVDENGNSKTVKTTVQVADPNNYSPYARFFDNGCKGWEKDPEYNMLTLRTAQNYANDKLRAQGYLFLNEVYDLLGIPRTKAGQVVGWVYDEKNPVGDNFVDFGIYDMNHEKARDFVNGYECTILLDFNVDGNIWELMK